MNKGSMFYKIFIPILVLGVGLVASFGSYIYINTVNSVHERIADSKQNFITQTKNNLENKIQSIEYAFDTYSTTTSFSDTVTHPITEQDFIAYRNVNSQLNYIATMGMEGTEYSLISLERDWQISNGKLSKLSAGEHEALVRAYIEDKDQSLFWIKTDIGIRFVNTLPVFSKKKQAIALSDISLNSLDQTIRTEDHSDVFILNRQGDLMYQTNPEQNFLKTEDLKDVARRMEGAEPTGMLTLDRAGHSATPMKVIYAKSEYNNWIYLTLLDRSEIADALKLTLFGLITMGAVLTLLIVIVAYIFSVYFTRPIQRIKRSLPDDGPAASRNEVEWILHSIDTIITEKESLKNLMEAEKPQLETQLILNLFRNRVTPEELAWKLPRLGYRQTDEIQYVTLLIQLDSLGEREASDKDVLLLAINKLAEEQIPPEHRMLPIILNDKTQATILLFDNSISEQEIRKETLELATSLMKSVREYLKISVSIGISKSYGSLLESKEACEMSKLALHHRLNLGKESIIFYADISNVVSGPVLLHYPVELESKLFDAIRLGDEEQVSQTLYLLLAEMMKKNKYSMNFEVALVRFVNNLIQLEQVLGIEVLLTQNNYALYHVLLDTRNPEEIERMLVEEVIFPMVRSMKHKTNQQFRCLSEEIAAIVRAEYDQELSLDMIAERLHYNPNYLSSIFKKEYGTTFTEYLMSYRLDMAKKWLTETDMTIKEIAERLQYHKPQNFIRSFRKKEHVTPGEYRKARQAV
ncbi:helix-turn-helix domain-containing protein [Paenibacillus sanfengchensis]|uniref:helix-turn-helix domain-containing protein n=1 Tax=Paenibacillus sanfengchensis TaxID=3119819 RepID=UPI002FDFA094